MIPLNSFAGRRVAVFGLGASGLVAARALAAGGAAVVCWDDDESHVDRARREGLATGNLGTMDFSRFDALVLAPGVPLTHPAPHWSVMAARGAGVEVIGDIELYERERVARFPGQRLVAITGTNGKSTTTALIGHLLEAIGERALVGGNIGRPVLGFDADPEAITVLEVSSFQIDLSPSLAANVGVHLNLSPDHLDRHGTMQNYAAIKQRLVEAAAAAVIGVDDPLSLAIARRLEATGKPVLRVSTEGPVPVGVSARGSVLTLHGLDHEVEVANLEGIATLRGKHNAQNAAAAIAVISALGLDPHAAARALASFPGLPHRLEQVGRSGGVLFINDSKATNADSTRQALAAFDEVYWIAGGRPKAGGIGSLDDLFGRVRRAYLIGEAAPAFAGTLAGKVPATISGTLERALEAAAGDAAREAPDGAVVLLSPACASYDQFANYGQRGDRFRSLVAAMLARQEENA